MALEQKNVKHPARWWRQIDDGRVMCDLCPRYCRLKEGQRAFCFVRQRVDDAMVLTTYGRSTGFCIDPIEKKPLNHFLPGTPVLSFGTAGCNLGCRFCQNWGLSNSRDVDSLCDAATPDEVAAAAASYGCDSVAFTYNDPIIFAEYAIDTATACHRRGIKTVAVTSGFITAAARPEFFEPIDAANIDLKGFTDEFYKKVCLSKPGGLQDVLDTLLWLAHESSVWFEITTLLIPGLNDSDDEIGRECEWIAEELGSEVPLHFTAFHPDFHVVDRPSTPKQTLRRARAIARDKGLRHVYTGNVHDPDGQTTSCPSCQAKLIERDGYEIRGYRLDAHGRCKACGHALAGTFGANAGTWGSRRQPVLLGGTL